MSQPSRAAESGADSVDIKWGQLDLSADFKLQTLLICEAIVCGSEPAHSVPSAAPWSQRFCSSSWGTDNKST